MFIVDIFTEALRAVLELPWHIKGPGLALVAFFLFRSFTQFVTLHPIRAITSIVYAFIVAIILSRFGTTIAEWIASQNLV